MDKTCADPDTAVADIPTGATIAVGGFGLCGIPNRLIHAVHASGVAELDIVSNNCGVDDWGLGILLRDKRIQRIRGSYVGENKEFERQFLKGELDVELIPQGTLAERLRAGGAGIPAFYTQAGVGTPIADGGMAQRYTPDGEVAVASEPKEVREFHGTPYVLEEAITCDYSLIHAARADTHGNVSFHGAADNFNTPCAMAGGITIVEAEEIVEPGELSPENIHLPGIFVQRLVWADVSDPRSEKRIEKRTVRS